MAHHADGSSIQQHSAGAIYPYILVGFGDDTWAVQAPDGTTGQRALTPGGALFWHHAGLDRTPA